MQTIGERLEEARKRKGITIREAAEATKIRGDYLQKFESNQFDINLSDIYVRGFLRTYCNFLKLPHERIIADFKALGLGEMNKPKGVSREVYGRMDLSFASSNGSNKAAKEEIPSVDTEDSGAEGSGSRRVFARIGTSLPEGTFIDQRQLIKIGGIAGGVILVLLIVWGVHSMSSGSKNDSAAAANNTAAQQHGPSVPKPRALTITATDTVMVTVAVQAGEGLPPGEVLFSGTLSRGETKTIQRGNNWLSFYASNMDAIEMDVNGAHYKMSEKGFHGPLRIQLQP